MSTTGRCIAFNGDRRCPHPPAMRNGDLFCCTRHGLIQMAIIDDRLAPQTRKMLAVSKWETAREGQRLIDRFCARRAAA